MFARRGDLRRLGRYFVDHDIKIEEHKWAAVITDCLVFGHGRPDWYHVADFARECGLRWDADDDQDAYDAFAKQCEKADERGLRYRPFCDRAVGGMLGVTLEIKIATKLVTVKAYDETREAELARKKQTKLIRDREYQRQKRAARPRAKSRGAYLAESRTRTQPWIAMGMSKATWYRKGLHRETSPSPTLQAISGSDVPVSPLSASEIVSKAPAKAETSSERRAASIGDVGQQGTIGVVTPPSAFWRKVERAPALPGYAVAVRIGGSWTEAA